MNPVILTFDLEYWFESYSLKKYLKGTENDSVANFVDRAVVLLGKNGATATFFVTEKVLSREPELVKKLHLTGQEIAIHSFDHKPLWQKTPEDFTEEIKLMKEKIKALTGINPIGHRAPNFSLDYRTGWCLQILRDQKLKYDSSLFPYQLPKIINHIFKDSAYGFNSERFTPYIINQTELIKKDLTHPLIEFPLSVYHWRKFRLPLTGGIYIRLIPWIVFSYLLRKKLKRETACLHFHPFDFLAHPPNIPMPRHKKFIKFFNTNRTWQKLETLMAQYRCLSIRHYYEQYYD